MSRPTHAPTPVIASRYTAPVTPSFENFEVSSIDVAPHNPLVVIEPVSYFDYDQTPEKPWFPADGLLRARQEMQRRANDTIYGIITRHTNLEEIRAKENKHQQEYVRSVVDTGPDYDMRALFAVMCEDGYYRTYDMKTIVPKKLYEAQWKRCYMNPHEFQARVAYEITKWEEQEQEPGWQMFLDKGLELKLTHHQIFEVFIGLAFMNKPTMLTWKHREFIDKRVRDRNGAIVMVQEREPETVGGRPVYREYRDMRDLDKKGRPKKKYELVTKPVFEYTMKVDADDMPVLDQHGNPVMEKTPKMVPKTIEHEVEIGEVKPRAYAIELRDKFPAGLRFATYDVVKMKQFAYEAFEILAKYHNNPIMVKTPKFRNALLVLSAIRQTVEMSKMSPGMSDPGADGAGAQEMNEQRLAEERRLHLQQSQAVQEALRRKAIEDGVDPDKIPQLVQQRMTSAYPPKIYGSSSANIKWVELSRITDRAGALWPVLDQIPDSDYVRTPGPSVDWDRTKK